MSRTKSEDLPIQVRDSAIHGSGAFAARRLKPGDSIGRYTGKVYSPSEFSERDWDDALTYVFGLADGSVIDGADGGNATRHINHSCSPNCVAYEIESDTGEAWIVIEALHTIKAGAELYLDYRLETESDSLEHFVCRCGSKACRGTLIGAALPTKTPL